MCKMLLLNDFQNSNEMNIFTVFRFSSSLIGEFYRKIGFYIDISKADFTKQTHCWYEKNCLCAQEQTTIHFDIKKFLSFAF